MAGIGVCSFTLVDARSPGHNISLLSGQVLSKDLDTVLKAPRVIIASMSSAHPTLALVTLHYMVGNR